MIVLGLGGNVGSDEAIAGRFQRVCDALSAFGEVRCAPVYRTAPIGPAQAPFLNTAVAFEATLDEAALMALVRELEALLGRVRDVRWGPRTIDIDVLVWDQRVIHTHELVVPHPRLHERRFALQPLVDLVGADFEIPNVGLAGDTLARVLDQTAELVATELRQVRAVRVEQ